MYLLRLFIRKYLWDLRNATSYCSLTWWVTCPRLIFLFSLKLKSFFQKRNINISWKDATKQNHNHISGHTNSQQLSYIREATFSWKPRKRFLLLCSEDPFRAGSGTISELQFYFVLFKKKSGSQLEACPEPMYVSRKQTKKFLQRVSSQPPGALAISRALQEQVCNPMTAEVFYAIDAIQLTNSTAYSLHLLKFPEKQHHKELNYFT